MVRFRGRRDRDARELARLLVKLDRAAGDARPWRPRRAVRISVAAR